LQDFYLRRRREAHDYRISRAPCSRAFVCGFAVVVALSALGCASSSAEESAPPAKDLELPHDSVGVIDPTTNAVLAHIPVGRKPLDIAFLDGSVWVANVDDETVSKIDAETRKVVATIEVGAAPTGLAAGEGSVWVTNGIAGTLQRIDPGTARVEETIHLRRKLSTNLFKNIASHLVSGPAFMPVAAGAGSVWVSDLNASRILRIDPHRGEVVQRLAGYSAQSLLVNPEGLWLVDYTARQLVRVDPDSGDVEARVQLDETAAPKAFAVVGDSAWVANTGPSAGLAPNIVWRVEQDAVAGDITVGYLPAAVAADESSVWVGSWGDHDLSRIDRATNRVVATLALGRNIGGVALGGGAVWVTAQ
jgi:YVTN family beta-propeller protein